MATLRKKVGVIITLFCYDIPFLLVTGLLFWMPDNRFTIRLRGAMVRPFIKKCGRGFMLGSAVRLLNTDRLEIGDNVYIARGCWLNCYGGMVIEDEVVFGPFVVISTLVHGFKNGSTYGAPSDSGPVRIGRGCWLASHVSVRAGSTIGCGVLVAANAAVVKDVPDNVIVGGVPAKVISERKDTDYNVRGRWIDEDK